METMTENRPVSSMEVTTTTQSRPKSGIVRDAPRYVVLAGDYMPPDTKRNFKDIPGSHIGGMHFQVNKFPGLWKFQGFVTRARITPLLKKEVKAGASERKAVEAAKQDTEAFINETTGEIKTLPDVFRTVFPWDTFLSLQAEHVKRKGIVGIPELEGIDWDTGIARDIQFAIFPNWKEIEAGQAELPFAVSEFQNLINRRYNEISDDTVKACCKALIESADIFTSNVKTIIGGARESVRKGMYESGFAHIYHPYHYHLAAQIGEDLEATAKIVGSVPQASASPAAPAMSQEMIDLETRRVAALERQNELLERQLEQSSQPATAAATSAPVQTEDAETTAKNTNKNKDK
jgi:hypothetical protein